MKECVVTSAGQPNPLTPFPVKEGGTERFWAHQLDEENLEKLGGLVFSYCAYYGAVGAGWLAGA